MRTKIVEAVSDAGNYGKFLVGVFDHEYEHRDLGGYLFIGPRWGYQPGGHVMVFDIETGEGGMFRPGGLARADLRKRRIWVCVLFEPFLEKLYDIWDGDLDHLPDRVELTGIDLQLAGYRRPGTTEDLIKELAVRFEQMEDTDGRYWNDDYRRAQLAVELIEERLRQRLAAAGSAEASPASEGAAEPSGA